jgi:hypothetical protein
MQVFQFLGINPKLCFRIKVNHQSRTLEHLHHVKLLRVTTLHLYQDSRFSKDLQR